MSRTLSLAVEGGPHCGVLDLSANMPKSEQAAERNARVALASVKEVEPAGDLSEQPDEALIDLALSGEQASFETLVRRHSRRVFTIARHFFRHPEMVEDIAQETFAKAFFSLSTYRRGASFEQWIARIAVNNCYDELRRRKRRGEYLITDLSEDEGLWLETALASTSFGVQRDLDNQAQAAEIAEHLLAGLEPEDRLVLVLLHAEELSVKEIAKYLDWSEAKVKIRAFRARNAARKALRRLTLAEERRRRHD